MGETDSMESFDYVSWAVEIEVVVASKKFGPFLSCHEGYAILKEEVDELWTEIKTKNRSKQKMFNEAKQVAAMAMRFMMDLEAGRIK